VYFHRNSEISIIISLLHSFRHVKEKPPCIPSKLTLVSNSITMDNGLWVMSTKGSLMPSCPWLENFLIILCYHPKQIWEPDLLCVRPTGVWHVHWHATSCYIKLSQILTIENLVKYLKTKLKFFVIWENGSWFYSYNFYSHFSTGTGNTQLFLLFHTIS
jgi:hypothetical protein